MSRLKKIRVEQGDSLRTIAQRELQNPVRWTELIDLNDLRLPFIVESRRPEDRQPHTVIWGDTLLVPWESNVKKQVGAVPVYGVDVMLDRGNLRSLNGDLDLVSGRDNMVQALSNRLKTLRNELVYHPGYGSHISLALGLKMPPFINLMASAWVQECLQEEPRIASVEKVQARVDGDALRVSASVILQSDNAPLDLNLVINP